MVVITIRERIFTDDKCPDNVKFKGEANFPVKILVWIVISEFAISKPLFRKSKAVALNRPNYLEQCLRNNSCHSLISFTKTQTFFDPI